MRSNLVPNALPATAFKPCWAANLPMAAAPLMLAPAKPPRTGGPTTAAEWHCHGEQSIWPTMPNARESLIGGKSKNAKDDNQQAD